MNRLVLTCCAVRLVFVSAFVAERAAEQALPNGLKMNRDDGLLWISLFWFVVLCGLAIWALLRL